MARSTTRIETTRQWLAGLAITAVTIVSVLGFARLSRGWTIAVAGTALVALLILFWSVGRSRRSGRLR